MALKNRRSENGPLPVFIARAKGTEDVTVSSYVDEGTSIIASTAPEIYAPLSLSGDKLVPVSKSLTITASELGGLKKLCECKNETCGAEIFTSNEFASIMEDGDSVACTICGTENSISMEKKASPEAAKPEVIEKKTEAEVVATVVEETPAAVVTPVAKTEEAPKVEATKIEDETEDKEISNLISELDQIIASEETNEDEILSAEIDSILASSDDNDEENENDDENDDNEDDENSDEDDEENDEENENENDDEFDEVDEDEENEDEMASTVSIEISSLIDFDDVASISVVQVRPSVLAVFVEEAGTIVNLGTLHAEKATKENQSLFTKFDSEVASAAFRAAVENNDSVDAFGFKAIVRDIPIDSLIEKAAEEKVTTLEAASASSSEAYKAEFKQAVGIAAAGMNKMVYENPLLAAVSVELSRRNIANSGRVAANIITASADEYVRTLLAKAEEILSEDINAREAIAKLVANAKPMLSEIPQANLGDLSTAAIVEEASLSMYGNDSTAVKKDPALPVQGKRLFRAY